METINLLENKFLSF